MKRFNIKRISLAHRPGRPQGTKKGKRGYSRPAEKQKLLNMFKEEI